MLFYLAIFDAILQDFLILIYLKLKKVGKMYIVTDKHYDAQKKYFYL